MPLSVLPLGAPLGAYAAQADTLRAAWRAGEPWAVELLHQRHPRFLDERVPWLPKPLSAEEIRATPLDANDARLAVARWYDFADWPALGAHVVALQAPESLVARFEATVDAVVAGDIDGLAATLAATRAWSTLVPPASPTSTRRCTAPRCSTTSPRTASKAIARRRQRTRSR